MELIIIIAIMAILAAIFIPDNNFSYLAASIIAKSQTASQPLKKEIENYYYKNKKFPNKKDLKTVIENTKKSDHTKSLELLSNGQIKITYLSRHPKKGIIQWLNQFNPLSNDLADKDLILVPTIIKNKFIWDECNFGTVPKRNRDYKCSSHK